MQYTTLGRTGLRVSRLGFGAMRLPMKGDRVDRDLSTPLLRRAVEAGINYIDTAVFYCGGDSQSAVGEALQDMRDRVVLSTKNHYFGEDEGEWRRLLEESLERLRVDTIDIYNTHGVNAASLRDAVRPRVHGWLLRAREEGLIRHICTSFHDKPDALREVVDSGIYASVTLQYNMLNRELEEAMAYAHEAGLGIVVMGPLGGGRLSGTSNVLSTLLPSVTRVPELGLRFVAANPHVNVVLSGMSTLQQVEENVRALDKPGTLSADEVALINEQVGRLRNLSDLPCTACGYCLPCPHGVDIPRVFDHYNQARVYDIWDFSRRVYGNWVKQNPETGRPANACIQCGACTPKCPQKIEIPARLAEAHRALTGPETDTPACPA